MRRIAIAALLLFGAVISGQAAPKKVYIPPEEEATSAVRKALAARLNATERYEVTSSLAEADLIINLLCMEIKLESEYGCTTGE